MLIETVAFYEKTAADILSPDDNRPVEPDTRDQEVNHKPVAGSHLHTFKQMLRFALAGGLNTLVDLLILNSLLWLFPTNSSGMLLAYNSLAYSIGAINSFLLNKYWTFGQKQRTTRAELARFTLVTMCGIAWSSIILWLASRALHAYLLDTTVWANASKLVAIGGTALISYLGMRLWVFVSKQSGKQIMLNGAVSVPETIRNAEQLLEVSMRQEAITARGVQHPGPYENTRASNHSLSVVLPAYNEEQIIGRTVSAVLDTLGAWRVDAEVLVVNDGSTDRTGAIVAALAETNPRVHLVTHPTNQGYGAALVSGFAAATKDLSLFMDSDGQFDICDLQRFFPFIDEYDAVIGYRLNRQDSWMRKLNAWGWKRLIGWVLDVHVRDIDCAFKLLRTSILHQYPLETRGAMINAELLYRLKCAGYTYREVGVQHLPRQGGRATGANPRVIARAFRELFIYARKWRREEQAQTQPLYISERHPF
jgi:putative flippase GtrA